MASALYLMCSNIWTFYYWVWWWWWRQQQQSQHQQYLSLKCWQNEYSEHGFSVSKICLVELSPFLFSTSQKCCIYAHTQKYRTSTLNAPHFILSVWKVWNGLNAYHVHHWFNQSLSSPCPSPSLPSLFPALTYFDCVSIVLFLSGNYCCFSMRYNRTVTAQRNNKSSLMYGHTGPFVQNSIEKYSDVEIKLEQENWYVLCVCVRERVYVAWLTCARDMMSRTCRTYIDGSRGGSGNTQQHRNTPRCYHCSIQQRVRKCNKTILTKINWMFNLCQIKIANENDRM